MALLLSTCAGIVLYGNGQLVGFTMPGDPYSRVKEGLSKSSLHCLTASTNILNELRLTDLPVASQL